jgi:hypothetical protein
LQVYTLSSKRPSFSWLQTQSPRKGLVTILVLFGSHVTTWAPFAARVTAEAVGHGDKVPEWWVDEPLFKLHFF